MIQRQAAVRRFCRLCDWRSAAAACFFPPNLHGMFGQMYHPPSDWPAVAMLVAIDAVRSH
jgi:hypothetical protein